jgi:hypothetical protein
VKLTEIFADNGGLDYSEVNPQAIAYAVGLIRQGLELSDVIKSTSERYPDTDWDDLHAAISSQYRRARVAGRQALSQRESRIRKLASGLLERLLSNDLTAQQVSEGQRRRKRTPLNESSDAKACPVEQTSTERADHRRH